jgi:hypothetical protein
MHAKYLSRYVCAIVGIVTCFADRLIIGNQFADATIWLAIATALAVFRVSKVIEDGVQVTPQVRYTDSLIRYIRYPLVDPLSLLILVLQSPREIRMWHQAKVRRRRSADPSVLKRCSQYLDSELQTRIFSWNKLEATCIVLSDIVTGNTKVR